MKNRWYRFFWTELGRRIIGQETSLPAYLPNEMACVLREYEGLTETEESVLRLGSRLSPRKSRNIYGYTWEILRSNGFSRGLRFKPWPGITMLIPFYRNNTAVIPQSFSKRIPPDKRALSLVGRSAAVLKTEFKLWVVPADWNDDILSIFTSGGVKACSLDNLTDICREDSF